MGLFDHALQEESPIAGKMKNCDGWAMYEPVQSSETAILCHGGVYQGVRYDPCPVRAECRSATESRAGSSPIQVNPRSLPMFNAGASRPLPQGPRPMVSTPVAAQYPTRVQPPQPSSYAGGHVQPFVPPADYPAAMRDPYVVPFQSIGEQPPVFLPTGDEGMMSRMGKNVAQGVVAAVGWQIFAMARSVKFW